VWGVEADIRTQTISENFDFTSANGNVSDMTSILITS